MDHLYVSCAVSRLAANGFVLEVSKDLFIF
jgi:hypothetical protein